uniref:Conjugal transfer protein traG n=1 Tax=uncultured bacterium A1Q1_fos_75 TaxID=1256589 RepID=L7VQN8_9BACT|nr:conjugal transfer protein traG [uncultured bacterium A1Q1_fos_75]
MTPGEILQLPANEELVLVSGTPPIRARKLKYYADENFAPRQLPPPSASMPEHRSRRSAVSNGDWSGPRRTIDERLDQPWSDLVSTTGREPERTHELQLLPGTEIHDADDQAQPREDDNEFEFDSDQPARGRKLN